MRIAASVVSVDVADRLVQVDVEGRPISFVAAVSLETAQALGALLASAHVPTPRQPSDLLRRAIAVAGTQRALADLIGVPRSTLNQVAVGKSPVSPSLAAQLEAYLAGHQAEAEALTARLARSLELLARETGDRVRAWRALVGELSERLGAQVAAERVGVPPSLWATWERTGHPHHAAQLRIRSVGADVLAVARGEARDGGDGGQC